MSVDRRDGLDLSALTGETLDRLARCYAAAGFQPVYIGEATAEDIRASHSSWARRLAVDSARPFWLVRFERVSCSR